MRIGDKEILKETTLSLEPGQLVAFIGESGSGKTTLLKALAGVTTPSSGSVTVNGEPVTSRLTDIGYLPQDEIVHPDLTVTESLRYSARLRLPSDSAEEVWACSRLLVSSVMRRNASRRSWRWHTRHVRSARPRIGAADFIGRISSVHVAGVAGHRTELSTLSAVG